MKYQIAIIGSTKRTKQCAQFLLDSKSFTIPWVITPEAKPQGRKKLVTPNPVALFTKKHDIPTVFVKNKLNEELKKQVYKLTQPDLILVVDFGYIIPNWLLNLAKIAPLNIHPSELPKWRGSSPGQFAILFNEQNSAVTLMVMDSKLDHGPIIHQDFFALNPNWNQEDYYQHAFNLICKNLDKKILSFTKNRKVTKQPDHSPTIIAKTLNKQDAFIPWEYIKMAMKGLCPTDLSPLSELIKAAYRSNQQFAFTLERATKAFNPWPHLWTIVETSKGKKRMKILEATTKAISFNDDFSTNEIEKQLILKTVHIEGKNPAKWNEVKNIIKNNAN